jgi:hypothetical protein
LVSVTICRRIARHRDSGKYNEYKDLLMDIQRRVPKHRSQTLILAVSAILALAVPGAVISTAVAGGEEAASTVRAPVFSPLRAGDRAYFLEFRARDDDAFGHAYMVLEIADARGAIRNAGHFGFGTATGAPSGLLSLFGSPGEIGFTGNDLARQPVETFRVRIDRATYQRIVQSAGDKRKSWTVYELLFFNCNTLLGDVATQAGLTAPAFDALFPAAYVQQLRELNQVRPVR